MTKEQRRAVEKWVAALRSKEFKQGKSYLRDAKDNYCCLGVAGRISEVPHQWLPDEDEDYFYLKAYDEEWTGGLPWAIYNELGLTGNDQEYLVHLNDEEGKTFPEIAQWIEDNILTREVTE